MISTLLLMSLGLTGAEGSHSLSDQEVKQTDAPFTFKARVNLVSVPVVVRDKKGREVGFLDKEKFQLYDRGKLQEISKFTFEKTSERTAALVAHLNDAGDATKTGNEISVGPSHFVAYFFDDQHLSFTDLTQVREAALRHLEKAAASRLTFDRQRVRAQQSGFHGGSRCASRRDQQDRSAVSAE